MQQAVSRAQWADALRVVACLMVVGIHVCGVGWYALSAESFDWNVANVVDSALRGAVPLFFMLSGAFLLEKDPEPKKLLLRTLRLFLLWLVFALLYAVRRDGFWLWKLPTYWLSEATDDTFTVTIMEKVLAEGAKRPKMEPVPHTWRYDEVKYTKAIIAF